MFTINRTDDFNKRKKAFFISVIFPGLGQIIIGRKSGLIFPFIIISSLFFLFFVRSNLILTNGFIVIGYLIIYAFNLYDAFFGPYHKKAPCQNGCPAHVDIPLYNKLIADKRFEEARAIVMLKMPFASICGTICTKECEKKCVRSGYDESVMIMDLKKTASKHNSAIVDYKIKKTNIKTAIIGAGPSGVSLAYFLARKGISADIYDRNESPGGTVRYAIPAFRIDGFDILTDMDAILGNDKINFNSDTNIDSYDKFENILNEHDFTVLAPGSNLSIKPEGICDDDKIMSGLEFLKNIKSSEKIDMKGNVIILGGGNTAVDTARTLKREGIDAKIYYRRKVSEMPASSDEVKEMLAEGVTIIDEMKLKSAARNGESIETVFVNRDGEDVIVLSDYLIYATGQKADLSMFEGKIIRKGDYKTCMKNLFFIEDQGSIVKSVSMAQRVAEAIIRKTFGIRGVIYNAFDKIECETAIRETPDASWNYQTPQKSARVNLDSCSKDKFNWSKCRRDLTDSEAVEQAKRCLDCPNR